MGQSMEAFIRVSFAGLLARIALEIWCIIPLRPCVWQSIPVKSIPPNTEKWLRKLYDKNYNNDTSNEDKRETNYSMNNDTRNMHITRACIESAQSLSHFVHLVSHASHGSRSESRHLSSMFMCVSP